MSAVKRKLKTLSLSEKLKVLEAVKNCQRKKDVAKKFGLPISTLSTIIKDEANIMNKIRNGHNLSRKRLRITAFPGLEEYLLNCFKQCHNKNISVSGPLIKEHAQIYAKSLGLTNFRASNGWLDKFKKRYELLFTKNYGENERIKTEIYKQWKSQLQSLIQDYESKDIFNADETRLFFKCLNDNTLNVENDQCQSVKHIKGRLTILLAVNMSGTEKIPPLVIGKAKNPRCFSKCKSLPLQYESNTKAWMSSNIFKNWLLNLDKKMAKEHRKILLFIDHCKAHNDIPQMTAVKVQYLPDNTSSKLQPMDQGIIKNFKSLYQKEVKNNLLEEENNSTVDLLRVIRMIDKAWRNVTETIINNCYKLCGFTKSFTEEAETIETPTEWNTEVSKTEQCSEDFVTCDYDASTVGTLSDDEIADVVALKIEVNDLDDTEDEKTLETSSVSIKEARIALNTLRNFIEQSSHSDEKEFAALYTLDNAIDKELSNTS